MVAAHFVTHPDVVIDPGVPVAEWPLSERGLERIPRASGLPWARGIGAVFSSAERKARNGAAILAGALGLAGREVVPGLGENDRSATGYLPKAEFEAHADAFFARPAERVRGWERAVDAQRRIVDAAAEALARAPAGADVAIVSHGGVGALLLCHLQGRPIARDADRPPTEGGNRFAFDAATLRLLHGWRPIEEA